mmetsp:Transcript_4509/g.17070  ORF Transcript_4509/g.17070 Transcript_4509/m.17070 type:complete len:83 (+) Transcript_4509:46-294(+)
MSIEFAVVEQFGVLCLLESHVSERFVWRIKHSVQDTDHHPPPSKSDKSNRVVHLKIYRLHCSSHTFIHTQLSLMFTERWLCS